jgi:hypothetical protein
VSSRTPSYEPEPPESGAGRERDVSERDDLIAGLARGDEAAIERLRQWLKDVQVLADQFESTPIEYDRRA